MQWDLVCEKDGLAQVSQTILVFGVMTGAVLFPILSDRIGRKPVFMFSQMALVAVGLASALVDKIYFFLALRFLTGAFLSVSESVLQIGKSFK